MTIPTPARCMAVYHRVWDDSASLDSDRGRAIVAEMVGIATADTLDAAVAVVAWWWGGAPTAEDRKAVARARRLLRGWM
jgi:hypothetical protein